MDTIDSLVRHYQETGECEQLVQTFHNYLMKYYKLFTAGEINLDNYDLRKFLCCFIKNEQIRKELIRGKYQTKNAISQAFHTVQYIRRAFNGYETYKQSHKDYPFDEVYRELVIIFLDCAKRYKDQGKSFKRYLYHAYRYHLKDFVNSKLFDGANKSSKYVDMYASNDLKPLDEAIDKESYDNHYPFEIDKHTDLSSNILWLNGINCNELFEDLSYIERYILVKAFLDNKSDKEIAQLTGLHPLSVYRIKKRLIDHYRELRGRGAIKWIR
jgi:DNA-directed RNA polymerase specialized sigma24 family protein